jgi:hypothetical protein
MIENKSPTRYDVSRYHTPRRLTLRLLLSLVRIDVDLLGLPADIEVVRELALVP